MLLLLQQLQPLQRPPHTHPQRRSGRLRREAPPPLWWVWVGRWSSWSSKNISKCIWNLLVSQPGAIFLGRSWQRGIRNGLPHGQFMIIFFWVNSYMLIISPMMMIIFLTLWHPCHTCLSPVDPLRVECTIPLGVRNCIFGRLCLLKICRMKVSLTQTYLVKPARTRAKQCARHMWHDQLQAAAQGCTSRK